MLNPVTLLAGEAEAEAAEGSVMLPRVVDARLQWSFGRQTPKADHAFCRAEFGRPRSSGVRARGLRGLAAVASRRQLTMLPEPQGGGIGPALRFAVKADAGTLHCRLSAPGFRAARRSTLIRGADGPGNEERAPDMPGCRSHGDG